MKHSLVAGICGLLLCLATFASARLEAPCRVTLRLVDSQTGETLPGLIRIAGRAGKPIDVPVAADAQGSVHELLSRGLGLKDQPAIERWSVVTGQVTLQLPRETLAIEAFSGLETEIASKTLDLTGLEEIHVVIPLARFYDAAARGMRSANTHLHLMKLSREQADRYLIEVPQADRLDVLFVSYLERAKADHDYITNRYSPADLERLAQVSGTVFGNGEEHRHNFSAMGQGYGHVMLLDIPRLIQPVSIGPGITNAGTDGLPLQRGIDQARRDEATVIWCHNDWGLERIANQVTGRLDAQNIFDGGIDEHGSYKDSFYRGLNAGLKVPFSTGTDWFMYDFSRTYTKLTEPLTARSWLKALAAGRSYITNGPFLEFQVAGREPGERVKLDKPGSVAVVARGVGRVDFQRLELIQNGRVIRAQTSRPDAGHFVAELRFDLALTAPCWLALRTPPPPVKGDIDPSDSVSMNEYGQPLFAHTSAVDVQVEGRTHFDRTVALGLLTEMRDGLRTIDEQAQFADDTEKARVIDVYHDAIAEFERRLAADRRK